MYENNTLISIEQAAAIIDVSVSTFNRMRLSPELDLPRKVKMGNRVMFDRAEVEK